MNSKRCNVQSLSPLLPHKQLRVDNICILCKDDCDEKQKSPTDEEWEKFRKNAIKWKGLDKFGDIAESVKWSEGPLGKYWHKNCKSTLCGERKLQQAINRNNKAKAENQDEKKASVDDDERPATRNCIGPVHDNNLCIWCMKGYDKRHPDSKDTIHSVLNLETWKRIVASVPFLKEKSTRTRLEILVNGTANPLTSNIKYHSKCYLMYVTRANYNDESEGVCKVSIEEVKELFLKKVDKQVFVEGEPTTLTQLLKLYNNLLLDHGIVRTSLKTSDIKNMLKKRFSGKVGFQERYHRNESTFVFNKDDGGTFLEASINCWGVSDERLFQIAAKRLRNNVLSTSVPMKWPPSIAELCNFAEPHQLLHSFVKSIAGEANNIGTSSESLFLSDLLQSYITRKRTNLKTKFSVTLHGSIRSKVMSDLASDLGVAVSYKDVRYLYDNWAWREFYQNPVCPPELAEGYPGTAVIDNDDWKTEDITGETTSVNRSNMMFVQPMKWIPDPDNEQNSTLPRKDLKKELDNIAVSEHAIKSYYNKNRGKPGVYPMTDTSPTTTQPIRVRMVAHALLRKNLDCDDDLDDAIPDIPSFTGFMNSIMPFDDKSKAYYYLSLPKAPSKPVVFTLLEKAVAAAEEKNMPFIQCVGDQPVYTIIVELKNENPQKFEKVLPVLGSFHIQLSFMSAIYKRLQGSNIEDLLSEAGLITSGSVNKALQGKHYYQALRLYKLYYEALTRLLINYGEDLGIPCPEYVKDLLKSIKDLEQNRDSRFIAFETLIQSQDFLDYVELLRSNHDIPDNHLAKYVLSVMDMIEILFLNIDSLRRKDWQEFKNSLRLMMPWMIIYDNTNYGRWLPVFWLDMTTLSSEFEQYMPDIFSQSMTGNPYSAIPPDLWIECTMNRGSKLKSGWKYLLKNEKGLLVHIKNMNNVNLVRNTLINFVSEVKSKSTGHKENTKPRRRLDEKAVQDIMSLLDEWNADPFDTNNQELRTLMSGEIVEENITADLESAHDDGERLVKRIFDQRLFSNEKSIYDTLPRQKRNSFATLKAIDKQDEKGIMETKLATKLVNRYAEEGPQIFESRITDECLSVFNNNGTIRKGQKSKLVDALKFVEIKPKGYIAIIDAGFLWRLSTPNNDEYTKKDGTKITWKDYATKVFTTLVSRHPDASSFIFVNDYYGSDVVNPKDGERATRGKKFVGGDSPNVFPASNKELPSTRLFANFFKNNENKQRLQNFLLEEFRNLCKEYNICMIYCMRGKSIDISREPVKDVPFFNHAKLEADNAIFFLYNQIRKEDRVTAVVLDAEDTDILVTAAFVTTKVPGILGIKRKKGVFDSSQLCSKDMAKIAVRAYVMTGCDCISSFFGIGKLRVWNKIVKSEEAKELLMNLSIDSLRKFTIKYVYNDMTSITLAEMRHKKWKAMKKKNFSRIGIDEDTHINRSKRVMHIINSIENHESPSEFGNPLLHGFILNERLRCVPVKYTSSALPEHIHNSFISSMDQEELLPETPVETNEEETESESEEGEEDQEIDIYDECDEHV